MSNLFGFGGSPASHVYSAPSPTSSGNVVVEKNTDGCNTPAGNVLASSSSLFASQAAKTNELLNGMDECSREKLCLINECNKLIAEEIAGLDHTLVDLKQQKAFLVETSNAEGVGEIDFQIKSVQSSIIDKLDEAERILDYKDFMLRTKAYLRETRDNNYFFSYLKTGFETVGQMIGNKIDGGPADYWDAIRDRLQKAGRWDPSPETEVALSRTLMDTLNEGQERTEDDFIRYLIEY